MQTPPSFEDKNSPFYRQEKVKNFLTECELCIDLLDPNAEAVIRSKGDKYLIRRPDKVEATEAYDRRLASAVLINAYEAVGSWADMVASAGVTLSDDGTNPRTEAIFARADRIGNTLTTFSKRLFRDGVGAGAAFVAVEGPPTRGTMTREEAKRQGVRPWLSVFGPKQLLGWTEENGQVVEVRYYWEESIKDTEYSEKTIWKVRRYELSDNSVISTTWGWDGSLTAAVDVALPINRIPIVPFLPGDEIGLMLSYPPATLLASMTKAYYNSWSLQQNLGVICRTPLLTVIGATVEEVLHSLHSALCFPQNPQEVEVSYTEPTGAGAEFGWKDLEKIENVFRLWGIEIERQSGTVLATTKLLDNARVVNMIRSWSGELEKTLQQALEIAELFYGEKFPENGVKVGTEYGTPSLTNEQVQLVKLALDAGGLQGRQLFDIAKIYIPQLAEATWEDVLDSQIEQDQRTTYTGI